MSRWQAIVFDLDDTLYPECDYVLSGFKAVAAWAEVNLDIAAEQGFAQLQALFDQGVRGDTFNRWLDMHRLNSTTLIARLIKVYREHTPTITCFPEIQDMLAELHRSCKLGLVSDGYLDVQQRKFTALDVAHHFDAVVFSDQWGREFWKPHTRPFETVLSKLGVEGDDAVYVADNPSKDFLGARQLGMLTIWFKRHGGEYVRLSPPTPDYAPDTTVSTLDDLRSIVTKGKVKQ
ncbi:MAG: HAD family hydrolase [Chloroflexota bacterium]|nr:HAD family hydrolase [Chloroflexota bacterium]